MYSGVPCYLIGGGPSLRGFDFSVLKNKLTVAVNLAFRYAPFATMFFTEDLRFIERYGSELGGFGGEKVWHCLRGIDPAKGIKACVGLNIIRETRDDKFWAKDLSSLSFSSCSGVGAINLAEILGCRPIYLLGFDARTEGPMLGNFHDDYPEDWQVNRNNALTFKSDMEHWVAENCKAPIVNLINPAFESAIDCWPKKSFHQHFCASCATK